VGSQVVFELDYRRPVLYIIPIQSIMGTLAVVPSGNTKTIRITMFGACSRLVYMSSTTVTWIFRLCIGQIGFGTNMLLCGTPVHYLESGKEGALHLLGGSTFLGGSLAEIEVHTSSGIGNIFAEKTACYVYE
jgi:hypothetical protein